MIIRDNLTGFSADLEMSKMPKFDWTRTAMSSSLLLSPEGFGVEPYKLKESCKEAPYIVYGLFASLGHARLTAIKSAFRLDIIKSTPLCQNKFGPQKSSLHPLITLKNPCITLVQTFFWIHFLQDITKIAEP